MTDRQGIDRELCAREPIHIPGAVQPHGALLVLGEPDLTILQASRSCGALLDQGPERLLGRPIGDLFGAELCARLQGAPSAQDLADLNPLIVHLRLSDPHVRPFEATVHRQKGLLFLELEVPGPATATFDQVVGRFVASLQDTPTIAAAAALSAEHMAHVSGFDRVMIYRFDEQWNGEVIAEARREGLPAYLGLHYPASDIPEQARRLYAQKLLRVIVDVDYPPSPIVPQCNPRTGQPPDLGQAILRSVSPVHLEYLRNMGVRATLTVSILVEGSLWGLIACHHGAPRPVPFRDRAACELLGRMLSLHITALSAQEDRSQRSRLQQLHERIVLSLREHDLFAALALREQDLLQLTGAGGAAVLLHDRLSLFGETPGEEQTRTLIDWLRRRGVETEELYTRSLGELFPAAQDYSGPASGLLALSLLQQGQGFLLWFRPEVIRTVSWGGDPAKPMAPDEGGRLHPRTSFALWQQEQRGHAVAFRAWECAAAMDLRHALVSKIAEDENQAKQKAHASLVATARQAGMAEVATGILHNLGNALNSVSASATTLLDEVRHSAIGSLSRTAALLSEHRDVPGYLADDPAGKQIPGFVILLAETMEIEQRAVREELFGLQEGIEHIQEIVRTQQSYAGSFSMVESMKPEAVVEDALRLSSASLLRAGIKVNREFAELPALLLDKHKVLQILLNLISNARYAMNEVPAEDRVLTLRTEEGAHAMRIVVSDRGFGVAPENLLRIFQGLTTRHNGHGFGLHASVLAAQEMKGSLTVSSPGVGHGATFILELPR